MTPYYADDRVTLFLGDCLEVTEWLAADVLVTDPPYGRGWKRHGGGGRRVRGTARHDGIVGDRDTSVRDHALALWEPKPAAVHGSFYAPAPTGVGHLAVWRLPPNAGVLGSTIGWRRDVEPIYLLGDWPPRPAAWSSLLCTLAPSSGNPASLQGRYGHPHAKPVDVMEQIVRRCPPGMVADPFAGSGSTLVAARNLGRHAIGVEIEERYCEIAARRLAQDVLPLEAP